MLRQSAKRIFSNPNNTIKMMCSFFATKRDQLDILNTALQWEQLNSTSSDVLYHTTLASGEDCKIMIGDQFPDQPFYNLFVAGNKVASFDALELLPSCWTIPGTNNNSNSFPKS